MRHVRCRRRVGFRNNFEAAGLSLIPKIVAAVVADLNFGEDAAKGMKSRVRSSLLYLWKVRGSVIKEGERETAKWSISSLP